MAKPKIKLYVDVVSPFAYFAFYALENFPVFKQCEISYVPVFLGGIMKACNNTAPIQIKNKDKWINTERLRWARAFSIPVLATSPPGFPPNTIAAQRALTALQLARPAALPAALAAMYDAFWVRGEPITDAAVIGRAVASALGEDAGAAAAVVERSAAKEVKELLAARTGEAVEVDGAFGMPWFVATNAEGETECFWGFDHLGQVTDHLGLERPTAGGWKAML
ncbi:putative 2-hydroxychromene-2-carboxylate isomerase protein [Neofusicoccum parvum UCRNP2]|uniref:Glutathione S-transferase kappa n=2 Tax=Neofusicoccum parvum TaxID=310453 RepID=R1G939_BOTPV|nr:putative 2-hydroxychromene-2-carboxylate isomerase protein [Neofusicoccum parvum UCRNP2]GME24614.1 HCCA isomerase/glutathione S-transferase kappa [Neofusicoccum parvum]